MYRKLIKRLFDTLLSVFGLVFLCPLLVVVSMAIRILDGKPVLYSQERVGLNYAPFNMYKFRTMAIEQSDSNIQFDAGCTDRVSAIGGFLRKTKIDELPQLYNVLSGSMSLVGPRPEIHEWTQHYPERWDRVLVVRPGITDRASITYRNEEQLLANEGDPKAFYRDHVLPNKLEFYEKYVESISFKEDVSIIFDTLKSVIVHRNS